MAKYRILSGSYAQLGGLDADGNPLPNKIYRANSRNNVFESEKDMAKAVPGKYERVADAVPVSQPIDRHAEDQDTDLETDVDETNETEEPETYSQRSNEELEAMTVDQLRSLAEDEEVDVSTARKKSDFVALLAAHYDA